MMLKVSNRPTLQQDQQQDVVLPPAVAPWGNHDNGSINRMIHASQNTEPLIMTKPPHTGPPTCLKWASLQGQRNITTRCLWCARSCFFCLDQGFLVGHAHRGVYARWLARETGLKILGAARGRSHLKHRRCCSRSQRWDQRQPAIRRWWSRGRSTVLTMNSLLRIFQK